MKDTDAEKLIAKIEKRMNILDVESPFGIGGIIELELVKEIITSLQQEQTMPSCKSCGFYENNCPFIRGKFIPYPNKVCKDYTYSNEGAAGGGY